MKKAQKKPFKMCVHTNTFAKIKHLNQICISTTNCGHKWYSLHTVSILVNISALFFQQFPVSLSCFLCLYPFSSHPPSFSWDYFNQRSKNLSHFFSHACLLTLFSLIFSCSLFHCLALCVSVFLPTRSPLRFVLLSSRFLPSGKVEQRR